MSSLVIFIISSMIFIGGATCFSLIDRAIERMREGMAALSPKITFLCCAVALAIVVVERSVGGDQIVQCADTKLRGIVTTASSFTF